MTHLPVLHITIEEICQSVNISEAVMLELVDYHIVIPVAGSNPNEWLFDARTTSLVKKALRLQRDLAIDLADIALVLNLLEENETLLAENQRLAQRLSRFENEGDAS